jgi:glycerophosphoryl diester phosphodiesterase
VEAWQGVESRELAVSLRSVAAVAVMLAAGPAFAQPQIIAHRGPHQRFHTEGLTSETCTAARMLAPTHGYLENTLPSIRAAFELGADVVEIDVHPTTDGEFAVFHDWTLDCRTEGKGVTRQQPMAYLRTLDVGWGYTADGGRTYPFRGKGKAMMPTLHEVVRAFPRRAFLVNVKSDDPREAELLDAYLRARRIGAERLSFYGGARPMLRLRELRPGVKATFRLEAQDCLLKVLAAPPDAPAPESCRNSGTLGLPLNLAASVPGGAAALQQRMSPQGVTVQMVGVVDLRAPAVTGIDTLEDLAQLPSGWRGGVVTDRIEVIGPALKPRRARPPHLAP